MRDITPNRIMVTCTKKPEDWVSITRWSDGEWSIRVVVGSTGQEACVIISARDMDDIKSMINSH